MMYQNNFARSQLLRLGVAQLTRHWRRALLARDEPHVHARGANPVRMLMIGDSLAVGYGVLSHSLGFGGALARQLSDAIRRGVDIDIIAERRLSPRDALGAIDSLRLADYDGVIVSLGAMESIEHQRDDAWTLELRMLLERLEAADQLPVFVLGIPGSDTAGSELSIVRRFVEARSQALTGILADESARLNSVVFVPLAPIPGRTFARLPDRLIYEQWARQAMPWIAPIMATATHESAIQDEDARQAGLDALAILDSPDEDRFNRIASTARNLFGTTAAAIT